MARIGDTVRPELMRADTSGILRGSATGAAGIATGLASLGQSIGEGAQRQKAAKAEIAGSKKLAQAMVDLHGESSPIGQRLMPIIEALDSDELRRSEKLGIASTITPIIGAVTQKQATDIAAAQRKFENDLKSAAEVRADREADQVRQQRFLEAQRADRGLGIEEEKLDILKQQAATEAAAARAKAANPPLTEAEAAMEKTTATEMAPWVAGGGQKAQDQVNALDDILAQFGDQSVPLEDRLKLKDKSGGNIITGKVQGGVTKGPGFFAFGGDRARATKAARDKLQKIIVGTLRETLGAQFTENEAARILNLYWDDAQDENYNFDKVVALKKELQGRIDAKNQLQRNFEGTGRYFPRAGNVNPAPATPAAPGTPGATSATDGTTSRLGQLRQRNEERSNPSTLTGVTRAGVRLPNVRPENVDPGVQGGGVQMPGSQGMRLPIEGDDGQGSGLPAVELRETSFQTPPGGTVMEMGNRAALATANPAGTGLDLSPIPRAQIVPEERPTPRIPEEIKKNITVIPDHRNSQLFKTAAKNSKNVVSLDFNDADNKSARGIEVALSKKATPAQTKSAKKFVQLAHQFFKEAGVPNPIRPGREKPSGDQIPGLYYKFEGNPRMIYTEPFFASHPEARKAIEKNPRKYARLLVEAFGDLSNVAFIAPHTGTNRGTTSGGVTEQAWAKKHILPYLEELTR